jgi:hypothetical protein
MPHLALPYSEATLKTSEAKRLPVLDNSKQGLIREFP